MRFLEDKEYRHIYNSHYRFSTRVNENPIWKELEELNPIWEIGWRWGKKIARRMRKNHPPIEKREMRKLIHQVLAREEVESWNSQYQDWWAEEVNALMKTYFSYK